MFTHFSNILWKYYFQRPLRFSKVRSLAGKYCDLTSYGRRVCLSSEISILFHCCCLVSHRESIIMALKSIFWSRMRSIYLENFQYLLEQNVPPYVSSFFRLRSCWWFQRSIGWVRPCDSPSKRIRTCFGSASSPVGRRSPEDKQHFFGRIECWPWSRCQSSMQPPIDTGISTVAWIKRPRYALAWVSFRSNTCFNLVLVRWSGKHCDYRVKSSSCLLISVIIRMNLNFWCR